MISLLITPPAHTTGRPGYSFCAALVIFTTVSATQSRQVDLTPKEYDLLFYLVENKNIALSRDKLLSDIWGYDFFGDDRTIDTHIKNLRNNLGPYRDFIVTLRGVGYKFEYEN